MHRLGTGASQGARDDLLRAFDAIGVHASGDRDRFHRVVVALSVADAKRLVDVFAARGATLAGLRASPTSARTAVNALRHTFASAQLAAGVDLRTVAECLGHTDAGFTLKVYAHLMPDAADRARAALGAFFAPSAPDVPHAEQR